MTSLTVRRVIAAPAERLFAAWTTPELLRAWWGPAGVTCIAAEVDLRVGGAYRLGNRLPDGRVVWIEGTFERVTPPRELVYTWAIGNDPVSRVTVRFEPQGDDHTEVIIEHEQIASATVRDDHERGWHGCLDGLSRYLNTA